MRILYSASSGSDKQEETLNGMIGLMHHTEVEIPEEMIVTFSFESTMYHP